MIPPSAEIDRLIADARMADLAEAFACSGFSGLKRAGAEMVGPCPACGGTDCFALNPRKGKWNCRKGDIGGNDATGMVAHCMGIDVRTRTGLVAAAAAALGLAVPGEGEGEEERWRREKELADKRQKAAAEAKKRQADQNAFREREIAKARGKWERGGPVADSVDVRRYLGARCNIGRDDASRLKLRFLPDETLWHGQDEFKRPIAVHCGPAMVGAFIDWRGEVIGCHLTWIDLDRPPKYRPLIFAFDAGSARSSVRGPAPRIVSGACPATQGGRFAARSSLAGERRPCVAGQASATSGSAGPQYHNLAHAGPEGQAEDIQQELVPTKKMRGSKKGGLIPVAGEVSAERWVGAEGIENVLAAASAEGMRTDTFYFAAGDLGNLAGPGARHGRVAHPFLKQEARSGARGAEARSPDRDASNAATGPKKSPRAIFLPTPHPAEDQPEPPETAEALWLPEHVSELLLIADGDSEPYWTAAMMARAKARLSWPGRTVRIAWPPVGKDLTDLMQEAVG